MMKLLLHIWFVLLLLTSIFVGCNRAPHYDSRLVAADSIIYDSIWQAFSRLDSIKPTELTSSADQAYYSLLLTQARYINYLKLPGDSDINAAIKYYEKHSQEREKLTRAYIYKGAVMEEFEHFDEAMYYYKKAEVTAGEDDYFNRGYALLRMGKMYYYHHAYDGRDIEKLEQALDCFRQAKDTTYQIICLKDLGSIYRSSNAVQAEKNLNEAISLAKIIRDTSILIDGLNSMAYLYFMQKQHDKAYEELKQIKKYCKSGFSDVVYTTFASVYANLGMPDSAMWYLESAEGVQRQDSAFLRTNNYLEPLSQIAKARGDSIKYLRLSHQCDRNSFALLKDTNIVNIMNAELVFDKQHQIDIEKERMTKNTVLTAIAGAICLALLLAALLFYRRSHRYDKLVLELKDRSQSQINDLANLQGNINELKINDERLKGFILSHMGMMREMIEACYHEPNNRIAENMKRIVKFQDSNKDNWVKLYDYIDLEHNNIMTRTREQYPELNDRELLLLALTCMGFSYIQIAIIMGYSNATSVSVIKQRLVKKMELDCSLNEYIQNNDEM
ncbi:MAG: hypothetical protein IJK41_00785 [Muribaculaceae bacterium]|nr:hypothetical protein [Muribaculaceae bacterium]